MAQVISGFKVFDGDIVLRQGNAASQATAGLLLNGVKVVGVQGAAIADVTPAADGTLTGTALNLVIAALRAHGLIATAA